MNVRYRVELSQAERDELSAMLSGGTHAARKSSGPRFCWRPMPVLRGREGESFMTLRRKAARWTADNVEALKAARPLVPGGLNDRAADNWESLLAIADLAGGDWPSRRVRRR